MLSSLLLASTLLGAASVGAVPHSFNKRTGPSAIVQPIILQEVSDEAKIDKRGVTSDFAYLRSKHIYTTVLLGSGKQRVNLALDSGSHFPWVMSEETKLEERTKRLCSATGFFNKGQSSSFEGLPDSGVVRYADKSGASFQYGTDNVDMNNQDLGRFTFGVATEFKGTFESGVLGAGPEQLKYPHPTFLMNMYTNKKIASPTLSLYIGAEDKGQAIFGGIDTTKFSGTLERFDQLQAHKDKILPHWTVPISEISFSISGKRQPVLKGQVPAIVDSGATNHYLPEGIADVIAKKFKGFKKERNEKAGLTAYFVDCSNQVATDTFDLKIGGQTIRQPLNDFVYKYGKSCVLDVVGVHSKQAPFILGPGFFKNAYVVFDNQQPSVYIAERIDCKESNIVDVGDDREALKVQGQCAGTPPATQEGTQTTTTSSADSDVNQVSDKIKSVL